MQATTIAEAAVCSWPAPRDLTLRDLALYLSLADHPERDVTLRTSARDLRRVIAERIPAGL